MPPVHALALSLSLFFFPSVLFQVGSCFFAKGWPQTVILLSIPPVIMPSLLSEMESP
jgi:hypothetical protein